MSDDNFETHIIFWPSSSGWTKLLVIAIPGHLPGRFLLELSRDQGVGFGGTRISNYSKLRITWVQPAPALVDRYYQIGIDGATSANYLQAPLWRRLRGPHPGRSTSTCIVIGSEPTS